MRRFLPRRCLRLVMLSAIVIFLGKPVGAVDLNEAGKAAYLSGDYTGAERLFRRAIGGDPQNPLLHYHLAITLTRLTRWREAAAAYEHAIKLNPPPPLAAAAREGLRALAPILQPPAHRSPKRGESIALERSAGGWIAEVTLNDSTTGRFLVDTGASVCVISPDLATTLGLDRSRRAPSVSLQTLSGLTTGRLVRISTVRVGDVEVEDVAAVIHSTGPAMDGILGNSFLARFKVTLDPTRGVLNLEHR